MAKIISLISPECPHMNYTYIFVKITEI